MLQFWGGIPRTCTRRQVYAATSTSAGCLPDGFQQFPSTRDQRQGLLLGASCKLRQARLRCRALAQHRRGLRRRAPSGVIGSLKSTRRLLGILREPDHGTRPKNRTRMTFLVPIWAGAARQTAFAAYAGQAATATAWRTACAVAFNNSGAARPVGPRPAGEAAGKPAQCGAGPDRATGHGPGARARPPEQLSALTKEPTSGRDGW